MILDQDKIIAELEVLVESISCPQYVNDALALIKQLVKQIGTVKECNSRWRNLALCQEVELKTMHENTIQSFAERLKRYYDDKERYLGYSIAYNIDQVAQAMINGSTDNNCVACGDIIPEGRQVCPGCEGGDNG